MNPKLFKSFILSVLIVGLSLQSTDVMAFTAYPYHVEEMEYEDRKEIIKFYELTDENPEEIPKEDFERNKVTYTLVDIIKTKDELTEVVEISEEVKIETTSNDINIILQNLSTEKEHITDHGVSGMLFLDVNSIKTEVKGHSSKTYDVMENREYPNFTVKDPSLVPKSITVNGSVYSLDTVNWETMNSNATDHTPIGNNYKAIAVYKGKGSSSSVTGYVTTAVYSGTVTKSLGEKNIYKVHFISNDEYLSGSFDDGYENIKVENEKMESDNLNVVKSSKGLSITSIIAICLTILSGLSYMAYRLYKRFKGGDEDLEEYDYEEIESEDEDTEEYEDEEVTIK